MSVALAHKEFGDGPPLVVLHGLFGSGRNWTSAARRLGDEWRVYALDLRNHGESPWASNMSYVEMAEDLLSFWDSQGFDQAVLLGHSMGGKVAMSLALMRPDLVKALIVVDIAPVAYEEAFLDYAEAMRSLDLTGLTQRSEADDRLRAVVPDAGIRGFLLQNLKRGPDQFEWGVNLDVLAASMAEISAFPDILLDKTYEGRSLFLAGALSDHIRPEHHAAISDMFPSASFDEVPEAGHWVHAEAPDGFIERVSSFLTHENLLD